MESVSSCEEEPTSFQSRGRPDGGEGDEVGSSPPAPTFSTFTGHMSTTNGHTSTTNGHTSNGPTIKSKVSKPPIAIKPEAKRNNSVGDNGRPNERRDSRPNERRESNSTQNERLVSPNDRRESVGLLRRESVKSENGLLDRKNSR